VNDYEVGRATFGEMDVLSKTIKRDGDHYETEEDMHTEPRYVLSIWQDIDAESPREWDNVGTFLTWANYNSPDYNPYPDPSNFYEEWMGPVCTLCSEVLQPIDPEEHDGCAWEDEFGYTHCSEISGGVEVPHDSGPGIGKDGVLLDVYMYDHSIVTFRSSPHRSGNPFIGRAQHAEWDSGQVGFIYATAETLAKEGFSIENGEKYLTSEVEEYARWTEGSVYGYTITDNLTGEEESCGGFFYDPHDRNFLGEIPMPGGLTPFQLETMWKEAI
jgi:hypothetical protein